MANSRIDPLVSTEPIVDEEGKPTVYFMRQWNRQFEVNEEVVDLSGVVFAAGTGLDGGGTLGVDDPITFDLADTAVTAGTYGDGTNVAQITVDAQGRITAAADVAISGGGGSTVFVGDGRFAPPAVATFPTAYNHKAATTWSKDQYGGTTLSELNDTGAQFIGNFKPMPSGTWIATMRMRPMYVENTSNSMVGFMIRDSATNRNTLIRFNAVGGESWIYVSNYNVHAFSSNLSGNKDLHKDPEWIQVEDDGTNFIFRYSVDGVVWKDMVSVLRTSWMASPDELGFVLQPWQFPSQLNILYYDDKDDPAVTPTIPIALGDLNDVTLTTPADNSFLQYDLAGAEWIDFDLFGTANTWGADQTIGAFDFTVDTDTLFVDASDDAVRIGATARDAAALWSRLQVYGVDSSASGPHFSISTDADTYPLMYGLAYAHDNMGLLFDSYFDGGWKSSDIGSNFSIYKNADTLQIQYASGNAQGTTVSWSDGLVLDVNGDVTLPTGDLNLTVGGIHVGGAGAANYLDDYEEGTWTPVYDTFNNDAAGITYDNQWGTYRKIGNVVFIKGRIRTDAWTTAGTGNLRIEGLPFSAGSPGGVQAESIAIFLSGGWGGPIPTQLVVNAGVNYMGLMSDQIGTAVPSTDRVNAANSNDIIFNGYYMT